MSLTLAAKYNNAKTTLSTKILSGATSLTIPGGDTGKFPSTGYIWATLWYASNDISTGERVKVTAGLGSSTWTIVRAQGSPVTTAQTWDPGVGTVNIWLTGGAEEEQEQDSAIENHNHAPDGSNGALLAAQSVISTTLDNNLAAGWYNLTSTFTYASTTSVTVNADLTGLISIGTKIRLTQTTVKYFYVTAISVTTGTTTMTLLGGSDYAVANATITVPGFSLSENPIGFPGSFNYTPTFGANGSMVFSEVDNVVHRFRMEGRKVVIYLNFDGTTSGTASNAITVTIPSQLAPTNTISTADWGGGNARTNDSGIEGGTIYLDTTSSPVLFITKSDGTNFALGTGRGARLVFEYLLV